jgi:hypothetical protein
MSNGQQNYGKPQYRPIDNALLPEKEKARAQVPKQLQFTK